MTKLAILAVGAVLTACAVPAARDLTTPPATPDAATTPPAACTVTDGKADRRCTPGAVNPDVTPQTIKTTICVKGWTATVRPPASYTGSLKRQQKVRYGEATVPDSALEEDHLIPLAVGGAPRDPNNLWPEPRSGADAAAAKDREENQLHADVCAGRMSLADAQRKIVADWTH